MLKSSGELMHAALGRVQPPEGFRPGHVATDWVTLDDFIAFILGADALNNVANTV